MSRSKVQLKSEIIDGLEKMPMTTHGVSRYVNCHYNTAKDRLEELEDDGVVYQEENKWKLKE
jgi:predicted transcriptional regulator